MCACVRDREQWLRKYSASRGPEILCGETKEDPIAPEYQIFNFLTFNRCTK